MNGAENIKNKGKYTKPCVLPNIIETKYIIKPFLKKGCYVGAICGTTTVGKTFLVLDLALSIATGLDKWHGYKIKERKKVIYLTKDAELGGIYQRINAWLQKYDLDKKVLEDWFYVGGEEELNKFSIKSDAIRTDFIEDIKETRGDNIGLIILDTFSNFYEGRSENENVDVSDFLRKCNEIANKLNCIVLIVHHTAKGSDIYRGASAFKSDTSLFIEIRQKEGTDIREVETTKVKDGKTGLLLKYRLKEIVLGKDEDGDDITSCVVEQLSKDEEKDYETNQRKNEEINNLKADIKAGNIPVHIKENQGHKVYYIFKKDWSEFLKKTEGLGGKDANKETNCNEKRRAYRLCINNNIFPIYKGSVAKLYVLGRSNNPNMWEWELPDGEKIETDKSLHTAYSSKEIVDISPKLKEIGIDFFEEVPKL